MYNVFIKKISEINETNFNLLNKYRNEEKRIISNKAWSLLFDILRENYNIFLEEKDIIFNEYGKPYIKSKNLYFNISHSKNAIAIIVGDKECGIDIEYIDNKRNIEKLAYTFFDNEEQKTINNDIDLFYKIWTKKEAYYKSKGIGINNSLLKVNIQNMNIHSEKIIIDNMSYYLSYYVEK